MKHAKSVFAFAAAMLAATSAQALTETVDGIEWTYTISGGDASVGGGSSSSTAVPTSTSGAITIPSTLGGYRVTSIGNYAFYNCYGLTSVTIPYDVTSIGYYAFRGCTNLISVAIPGSGVTPLSLPVTVRSVGSAAFEGCTKLTSVTVSGAISLSSAFGGSRMVITNVVMAYGTTEIKDTFLKNCTNVRSVAIPNSVTRIYQNAFKDCREDIYDTETIPGVKLVDGWAVGYTDDCVGVIDLSGVRGLADYALSGCVGLVSAVLPDNINSIPTGAFSQSGLVFVELPQSATGIGDYAFQDCGRLGTIEIPANVWSIGAWAFYNCGRLSSVTIPAKTTRVGDRAFGSCLNLALIEVEDGNQYFCSIDGVLYSTLTRYTTGYRQLVACPAGKSGGCEIPPTVTDIARYAFENCGKLESLDIPISVTNIGDLAFNNCTNITSVTIPGYILRNGSHRSVTDCFPDYGENITNIVFAEGSTEIALDSSFWNLSSVTIPGSVNRIGAATFGGCENLTSVTIGEGVTSIGEWAFNSCGYFPFMENGQLMSVSIPESVTSIDCGAFSVCAGLASIRIPDCVAHLGEYAFLDCNEALYDTTTKPGLLLVDGWVVGCDDYRPETLDLTEIRGIADGVRIDCGNMTSLAIPDGVRSIGSYAFGNCTNLASITIPDSMANIGGDYDGDYGEAFEGYCNWDTATIPGVRLIDGWVVGYEESLSGDIDLTGIRGIAGHALDGCTGLSSVTIPNGVTGIGDYAFSGCGGLASLTIPDSVTFIGYEVFSGCDGLRELILPAHLRGRTSLMGIPSECVVSFRSFADSVSRALDCDMAFSCGGNAEWAVAANGGAAGGVCARSGAIGDSQSSWIGTAVEGAGTISFHWKVSSQARLDRLSFSVDGETLAFIAGEKGWAEASFRVEGDGPHTLRWTYAKSASGTAGADCGWLDNVRWTPRSEETIAVGDVPVPVSWLDGLPSLLGKHGGDHEAAAKAVAENGMSVADCYVAGLNPTNAAAKFEATIEIGANGQPVVKWTPELDEAEAEKRVYTVEGKENFADDWAPTNSASRFFRVKVELR